MKFKFIHEWFLSKVTVYAIIFNIDIAIIKVIFFEFVLLLSLKIFLVA